ncbi:cytotoxic and regulatory T-cell molecule [Porphyrio hochstetteri]
MTFTGVLHIAALFLMQGDFPGASSKTVTLKEGEDLNLRCTLSSGERSPRQWVNPDGFNIFLNTYRGLKDQRYELTHCSEDELSIRLSNVTVQDEGVYKCLYYSIPFQSENTAVKVLAAPSNPVLEVSQDTESSVTLSCYTRGCKPQPQITWLLDNGIELAGDTEHKLEADGKKWTATSTLRVLAYGPNSTASCIVRHQALGEEKLMASLWFEDLPRTVTKPNPAPTAVEVETSVSEGEHSTGSEVTSAGAGEEELSGSPGHHVPNGTETAPNSNSTENELTSTETSLPGENVSVMSLTTFEQDLKPDTIKKKANNLLLPILVAALIFVLLVIVLLFMRKLKKAHGVWKRENDVSEQTLESYKSKSNEDSPGHEKNKQAANPKPNVQYVTEGYVATTHKNLREKTTAISEKIFGCGKETDV